MTALAVPPVAVDTDNDPLRLLPISVNLLPTEVVAARAGRSARRVAVGVLVAAALGTGAWYYQATRDTGAAESELRQVQGESHSAVSGKRAFAELTGTKGRIAGARQRVQQVTTGDVDWSRLYPAIRSVAPTGVTLGGLSGNATITTQTGGAPTSDSTPGAGATTGSLIVTGHALDKPSVSTFATRLADVPGLSDPLVTSVASDSESKKITFTIHVSTTSKALSTRYTKAVK